MGTEACPIYPATPTQRVPHPGLHPTHRSLYPLTLHTSHSLPSIPPVLRDSSQKSDICTTPSCVIAGELLPWGGHKAIRGLPETKLRFFLS